MTKHRRLLQPYYEASGEQIMQAECLRQIGWCWNLCGEPQPALTALGRAYAISVKLENRWGETDFP